MTDVIYGEGRGLPAQKNRAMVSLVFLDGLVLEIRRDSVASEMVYVALGS
jgi:transposase-like protein